MASYTAKWGPKGFLVSPDKIVPFNGLSTSFSLKNENNTDTSGTPPKNTRGRESQTITFSTTYMTATGTDPRWQMGEWYGLIGAAYPLYVGGKQFGPPLLQLEKVDWSNYQYAPNGTIIAVDAAITLVEFTGATAPVSSKAAVKAPDMNLQRRQSSKDADALLDAAAAMAAQPSTTEKASKKGASI